MVEKKKGSPPSDSGLSEKIVQVIAWFLLISIFIADRILMKIVPPVSDTYYAAMFGVAAFGRGIKDFFSFWKK